MVENEIIEHKINFNELVRDIQADRILLPDFQRGFVWIDEEIQKKLIASVLTRMPIGSILLLVSDKNEYGYKVIGRKKYIVVKQEQETDILVLLDGQQRVTVLTNVFSSIIFDNLDNFDELISPSLKRRFFLKISYHDIESEEDIFGLRKLIFPLNNPEREEPNFLTESILKMIEVVTFNKLDQAPYNPNVKDKMKINTFCCQNGQFYIPLYLLIETREDESFCTMKLDDILDKIVLEVVDYMIGEYDNAVNQEEKSKFIEDKVWKEYRFEYSKGILPKREDLKVVLRRQGHYLWKERFKKYLYACINNLNLHKIIVPKSNRDRAIDIYENLNMGGITLSTFEMVMAKAAKEKIGDKRNLFDKIVSNIECEKTYPIYLIPEVMEGIYTNYVREYSYSASKKMCCFSEKKNEISKKYTDAFLNILCLLVNNKSHDPEKVSIDYIKRTKILRIDPKDIHKYCEIVCKGLDRACFFLQIRCGLRSIRELNYNLILVLVGYIFTNDIYFEKKEVHKKLEAWYWSAIFSGTFDKDQNSNMIKYLKLMLVSLKEQDQDYFFIKNLQNEMFQNKGFSNKEFLLQEDMTRAPKDVIRQTMCQFYLARTYKDIFEDVILHTLMEYSDKLEEHHIVPLGSTDLLYEETIKKIRRNKHHILNSPLNFILLLPETNRKIGSKSIKEYLKKCNPRSTVTLCLDVDADVSSEEKVKEHLEKRFRAVTTEIINHVEQLLR